MVWEGWSHANAHVATRKDNDHPSLAIKEANVQVEEYINDVVKIKDRKKRKIVLIEMPKEMYISVTDGPRKLRLTISDDLTVTVE